MVVDDPFCIAHAAVANLDGVAVEYFSKFVVFVEVFVYIYISGWIFQKVLAEIVQKDLILSQKALISNRRNLGLFAPTSMRFPSKDSKSKDLSF